LHMISTREIPDSESEEVIGVDSGIVRIATVNTAKVFKGGSVKHIRERRFKQRRDLQSARHKSRNQGIRTRIRVAKKQRLIHHGWPFSSLFAKISHVGSKHGIKVESVDARNTSRTCRCGHVDKANRTTQSTFRCVVCGYSHNADYVASHNVAARYVEQRYGTVTYRSESAPPGRAKKAACF
jgi:putative transposase